LKVGYIEYLNSFPFLHDAKENPIADIERIASTPAKLNEMIFNKELDISAISAFEYLDHQNDYFLLPDLCINSSGHVRSVLFFSKKPLEECSNETIHISNESATSVNLLKIILANKGLDNNTFEKINTTTTLTDCNNLLLIGDQALKFKSDAHPYCYDLSDLWHEISELPVVFAVWIVRKDASNNENKISKVYKQLLTSRDKLKANPQHYVELIEKEFENTPPDLVGYFENLDFQFHQKCIQSLELYANKLVDLNIIKPISNLEFFKNVTN
jgi:chorismate dehydratase